MQNKRKYLSLTKYNKQFPFAEFNLSQFVLRSLIQLVDRHDTTGATVTERSPLYDRHHAMVDLFRRAYNISRAEAPQIKICRSTAPLALSKSSLVKATLGNEHTFLPRPRSILLSFFFLS